MLKPVDYFKTQYDTLSNTFFQTHPNANDMEASGNAFVSIFVSAVNFLKLNSLTGKYEVYEMQSGSLANERLSPISINMKKIIILYVLFLGCSMVKGQETQIDKTISVTVPQNVEKPNKQALKLLLKSRNHTQILSPDNFKGLTYKFGDVLLQINADTGTFAMDRLEKFKMAQDNLNSEIPGQKYSSELRTLNNYKIALVKSEKPNFCYYRFMAINNKNNKIAFATIEYNKLDEANAKNILDHLLKNLKFK